MRRIVPPLLFALLTATAADARAADLAGLALDSSGLHCADTHIAARIEDGDRLVVEGPPDRLIAAEWIEHGIDVVLTSPEGDTDSAPAGYAREPLLLRTDARGRAEQAIAVTYRRPWARATLIGRCLDEDEVEAIRLQERRVALARTLLSMRRSMGTIDAPRLALVALSRSIDLLLRTPPDSTERLWLLMQLERLGSLGERHAWRVPWLTEARRIGATTGDRQATVLAEARGLDFQFWPDVASADAALLPVADEARSLGMLDVAAEVGSLRCHRLRYGGQSARAIECVAESIRRFRAIGDIEGETHEHLNHFTALSGGGRLAERRRAVAEGSVLAERSGDLRLRSRAALFRGALAWLEGDSELAFAELGASLDLARQSGYSMPLSTTERYLGRVYGLAGQPRRALHHLDAARAAVERRGEIDLAGEIGVTQARLLAHLGEEQAAEAMLAESIQVLGTSGRVNVLMGAHLRMADMLARRGERARAQAILDALPQNPETSWTWATRREMAQASLWILAGEAGKAASTLEPVLQDSLRQGLLDRTLEAAALLQEARLAQGESAEAAGLAEKMLSFGLPLAARVRFPMLRDELLAQLEPFALTQLWFTPSGEMPAERVLGLLTPLERIRVLERAPLPSPDQHGGLDVLESTLAQGSSADRIDAKRQAQLLELIRESQARPLPASARLGELSLPTIRAGDALVYLVHDDRRVGVLVGTQGGWRWYRDLDPQALHAAGARLLSLLSGGHADLQQIDEARRALESALGWPFGLDEPPAHLRVVVDARLADIPWPMLSAPGTAEVLADTTEIELLQSLASLEDDARPRQRVHVLGASASGSRLATLSSVSAEIAGVTDLWSTTDPVVRPAASRADLLAALSEEGAIVHVAAHGRGDRGLLEDAGLWLADAAAPTPTFVSALRLRTSPVTASLIVLAACDSGRSEIARAGGMGAVAGALIDAGARHVVGARWPVGDRAAEQFSRRFHAQLAARPDAPGLALRRAVAELRQDRSYRHPSHWAGWFVLARGLPQEADLGGPTAPR